MTGFNRLTGFKNCRFPENVLNNRYEIIIYNDGFKETFLHDRLKEKNPKSQIKYDNI